MSDSVKTSYLNRLLSDGRVGVCEAVDDVRENLGVNRRLVQILNELLHLRNTKKLSKVDK